MKGAVGVILVYNPEEQAHISDLQYWCADKPSPPASQGAICEVLLYHGCILQVRYLHCSNAIGAGPGDRLPAQATGDVPAAKGS